MLFLFLITLGRKFIETKVQSTAEPVVSYYLLQTHKVGSCEIIIFLCTLSIVSKACGWCCLNPIRQRKHVNSSYYAARAY